MSDKKIEFDPSFLEYKKNNSLDKNNLSIKSTELEPSTSKHKDSTDLLRTYFLDGIRKYLPNIMDELADKPLQIFLECELQGISFRHFKSFYCNSYNAGTSASMLMMTEEGRERLEGIKNAKRIKRTIEVWLQKHHILTEWMFEITFDALYLWSIYPDLLQDRAWQGVKTRASIYRESKVKPPQNFPIYDPLNETQEIYITRVLDITNKVLSQTVLVHTETSFKSHALQSISKKAKEYCRDVEDDLLAEGFIKPEKKQNLQRDIKWTILYQLDGLKPSEIARRHKQKIREEVTHRMVNNAIKRILILLNIPPRSANLKL